MGANVTGRTSLGKALLNIVSFINNGDPATLKSLALSSNTASFQIDFVNEGYTLHRLISEFEGAENGRGIKIEYSCAEILSKDLYEICRERLMPYGAKNYAQI